MSIKRRAASSFSGHRCRWRQQRRRWRRRTGDVSLRGSPATSLRHKWNRSLLTRRRKGGGEEGREEGFSSSAEGWRFDIGFVTFSSDRQVLNSTNWAAECNKGGGGRWVRWTFFSFFFFDSLLFTIEDPRRHVTVDDDDEEDVVGKGRRSWWEKKYEFADGLIWFMKGEEREREGGSGVFYYGRDDREKHDGSGYYFPR